MERLREGNWQVKGLIKMCLKNKLVTLAGETAAQNNGPSPPIKEGVQTSTECCRRRVGTAFVGLYVRE